MVPVIVVIAIIIGVMGTGVLMDAITGLPRIIMGVSGLSAASIMVIIGFMVISVMGCVFSFHVLHAFDAGWYVYASMIGAGVVLCRELVRGSVR